MELRPRVGSVLRLRHLLLPRRSVAPAPPRRQVAHVPHGALGLWHAHAVLHHQRWRQRLPEIRFLDPHAHAHGVDHGGAGASRAWRTRDPGCTCHPEANRRQSWPARMDSVGRALEVCGHHRSSPRSGRAVRRISVGVLLLAALQLGDHRSHRPRVDGGALPHHRLPVRSVADRDRPRAVSAAVPIPIAATARHNGTSCLLWGSDHDRNRAAARRLVWGDGPRLGSERDRRPASRRRDRLERRRDPDDCAGDCCRDPMEPQR